jgi:uncharacterized protein (TIGR02271 family)
MDLKGKLAQGMRIIDADKTEYGTIERYDDQYVYVGGHPVPYSAFDRMDDDGVHVGRDGLQYFGAVDGTRDVDREADIRVPVVEERLEVSTRPVELGEVEIRKTVEAEQVSIPVDVMRERVTVYRVDVANRPASAAELSAGFKEETIRIPVRGEEVFARKDAVVTGEVVIDRERITERETVVETIRRADVTVDEDYDTTRLTVPGHTGTPHASGVMAERTVEAARPVAGSEAGAGDDQSWDELRGEIREASEQSRR